VSNTPSSPQATALRAMVAMAIYVFLAAITVRVILGAAGVVALSFRELLIEAALLAVLAALPSYGFVRVLARREEKKPAASLPASSPGAVAPQAITDPLTGLLDRRAITVSLLDAMSQSTRYRTPMCLAMADVDRFQTLNDKYGDQTGDRLLADIAGVLSNELRLPDKAARFASDQFLFLFPHTKLAQARKIAERFRLAVQRARLSADGELLKTTMSFGVVEVKPGEDLEQLLGRADRTLQAAKDAGRNQVAVDGPRRAPAGGKRSTRLA
jgi:diguanylate cyclase (GGDEF)-like protein